MRAFFLLLALLFLPFPGMGTELASSIDEMLHLSVQASNVRLRAGAGTNFEVLGKASQGSKHASRYIADARTSKDRTGQPWYQLMARVEQQSDLDVIKLERPCWIRGDFVRTRPLTDEEKLKAAPLFTRTDQTLSQKPVEKNGPALQPTTPKADQSPVRHAMPDAPALSAMQNKAPAAQAAHFQAPEMAQPAMQDTAPTAQEKSPALSAASSAAKERPAAQSAPVWQERPAVSTPITGRTSSSEAPQDDRPAGNVTPPASPVLPAAQNSAEKTRTTVPLWEGAIRKDIGFTMWFDVQGEQAIGELRYAKSNTPIRLVGSLYEDRLFLREMLDDGRHSGFISGTVKDGTFTGEWRSPGKISKNGDHFTYAKGATFPMTARLQMGRGHLAVDWQTLPENIEGSYRYSYGEYDSEGTLNVRRDGEDRVAFNISSVNGAPGFHTADLPHEGWIEGRLEGNVLIHEDSRDCAVKMTFLEELIDVSYLPGRTCPGRFGLNASVIGMFRKVGAK